MNKKNILTSVILLCLGLVVYGLGFLGVFEPGRAALIGGLATNMGTIWTLYGLVSK